MDNELRPFWARFFNLNWQFGIIILSVICIPRFILVLRANESGNYGFIGLVMIISAIVPFIFLNKQGRRQAGIKPTHKFQYLILALVAGLVFSVLLHNVGQGLYGNNYENWYAYIGKSYNIPEDISAHDKQQMFMITAIIGMIFSPLGEELFFRGIVHSSFAKSLGDRKASMIDSLAFALTHLAHFGLVFVNNSWHFYLVPALIWVASMFFVGILFFQMKKYADSLWGAIICHAGFNLAMIYSIFYLI